MVYTDLITYCKDTKALMTEVAKVAPDKIVKDEQGNPVGFAVTKTPTIRNGAETLAVVRVDANNLAIIKKLKSLKVLAEVPAGGDLLAAMTKANKAIYDRVYDQTPRPVLDDKGQPVMDANGKPMTITPPALCGAFA